MKIAAAACICFALHLSGATFNVRDFGATGDGKTSDTAAVQKAFDACNPSGGMVVFPSGDYLCQPLTVHSRTTVKLDKGATLWAGTNQTDFMKTPGNWLAAKTSGEFVPFIGGKDLEDVTFTGEGKIDGNGFVWWPEAEKARQKKSGYTLPRPNLIVIERSKNLRFENLTLQNSPKFHLVPSDCDDVVISNVTFLAPAHAANTDAMDPSGHHYLITRCTVDVGDDNIAIKAGRKTTGGGFQSEDFTVTDCTFLHGHGMSIGSETLGGVRNVTVRNCVFDGTENGIRIKSDTRRGGIVENLVCDNITMKNVNPSMTLTCVYQGTSAGDKKQGGRAGDSTGGGRKQPSRFPQYSRQQLDRDVPGGGGLDPWPAGKLHLERGAGERQNIRRQAIQHHACERRAVEECLCNRTQRGAVQVGRRGGLGADQMNGCC